MLPPFFLPLEEIRVLNIRSNLPNTCTRSNERLYHATNLTQFIYVYQFKNPVNYLTITIEPKWTKLFVWTLHFWVLDFKCYLKRHIFVWVKQNRGKTFQPQFIICQVEVNWTFSIYLLCCNALNSVISRLKAHKSKKNEQSRWKTSETNLKERVQYL